MEAALAFTPVHRLAELIAANKLDPVELLEMYLSRIERYDRALHSYVSVMTDSARDLAKASAMAVRSGSPLGLLHGVPIAVKDLCDIEGLTTGAGSQRFSRLARKSTSTSTVVQRLRSSGAIILGKTHMTEFAFGAWGTNGVNGTPRNPWDTRQHRVPGGSSSGSGVAVAAGLAPAAIGSDTGGSVRIPASFCGIVGLKTTHGRVSTRGVVPLSRNLDTIGPLTRCVEDAVLLLRVLADDYASDGRPFDDQGFRQDIEGLRLGAPTNEQLGEISPSVASGFDAVCDVFRRLGARVDRIAFPDAYSGSSAEMQTIISAEGYAANSSVVEGGGPALDPNVLTRLLRGKEAPAALYISARERQAYHRVQFARFLGDFSALLMPTTPIAALPLGDVDEQSPAPSRLTRPVNYLGLCALALPIGLDPQGMPLSIQIIGGPNQEERILRVGRAYENAASGLPRPDLDSLG